MYDSGDYTVEQIAKAFKTTRPTIYRALDPQTIGKKPTRPGEAIDHRDLLRPRSLSADARRPPGPCKPGGEALMRLPHE